MGTLERRNDALRLGNGLECLQSFRVSDGDVIHTSRFLQPGVLGADARVVQASADRVGLCDLAVASLEKVRSGAVEDARGACGQSRRVGLLGVGIRGGVCHSATSLHTVDLHVLVLEEGGEGSDGIGAAADASDERVGQLARAVGEGWVDVGLVEHLRPGLVSDHGLQLADDVGEGVRPDGGADDVVGGPDVGDPVLHGLVDGVLQGLGSALGRDHLRSEHLHLEDVEGLSLDVNCAHVNDALEAHQGAGRGRGHAVLAGARLGDNSLLAELLGEEGLAEGVVDLVGASVGQLLALEPELGASQGLSQVLGKVEGGGASDELATEPLHLGLEVGINLDSIPGLAQVLVSLHQSLGDVSATELATEIPGVVALRGRELAGLLSRTLARIAVAVHDEGSTGQFLDQSLHLVQTIGHAEGLHNLRSDNSAVGVLANGLNVGSLGDTEADGAIDVFVGSRLLQGLDDTLHLVRDGGPGSSNTQDADNVDERVSDVGSHLHSLRGAGGSNDGNQRQAVLHAVSVEVAGLLSREIDNDEAIHTATNTVHASLLQPVLQEVVVVAHEDHRHGQTLLPCNLDKAQAILQADVLQHGLVGSLFDRRSIGHRVRERNTQFDDIGSAFLQSEQIPDCCFPLRVPGGGEGDEGCAAGGLAQLESLADSGGGHGEKRLRVGVR
mmetsp:Transcript_15479/g.33550  ORF Transcript_15479/g.33550 Transcript_15479/m.33550 type:complete len:670 (+) Transcript_15479:577-2586(+)